MVSKLRALPKSLVIGVCAVVLSTLGIQASDLTSGVAGPLTGLLLDSQSTCGEFETLILYGTHSVCMDTFEVSPSDDCPVPTTSSEVDTELNLAIPGCTADTKPEVLPWRHVTYTQASQLCARSGKRLPTNEEWYKVALGTSDVEGCFKTPGQLALSGQNNCQTSTGVHDMVGNVWEWVGDTVTNGQYRDRQLPESGYITLVDGEGVVLTTDVSPDAAFQSDYAWLQSDGVAGIIRGGFYGSGSDGGIFAQNLAVALDFSAVGVGFRCVRDVM